MERMSKATLAGAGAVLIWGAALPMTRYFQTEFGLLSVIGSVFGFSAILGFGYQRLNETSLPSPKVLLKPSFYLRWFCFVAHEVCVMLAVTLISHRNIPLVILLNYLWPTLTILSSIRFAGVRIRRAWAVASGSAAALLSLAYEFLGNTFRHLQQLSGHDYLGLCLALFGAASWAAYSTITRINGNDSGGGTVLPLFQATLALALPLSFLTRTALHFSPIGYFSGPFLLYCTVISLSYPLWDFSMRFGNIITTSLLADFIPLVSLLTAHLILGVGLTPTTLIAAVALVAAALLTRYGTTNHTSTERQTNI